MRLLLFLILLSPSANAQEWVDETDLKFPSQNPAEYTNDVALADVDNDGDLDIFFANGNGFVVAVAPEQSRLFLNDGNGNFQDATLTHVDLPPAYVRDADFADINGDGWVDLVLAGAFGDPPRLLMNKKDGTFHNQTVQRFPAHDGWWGSAVAVGDVDNDGDFDIYFTNSGEKLFGAPGGQDRLYINTGDAIFVDATPDRLPKIKTRASIHVKMVDLDNDRDLDIVVGNREVKNLLLLNDGTGTFKNQSVFMDSDGKLSREIQPGDLNGDGWMDLLVVNGSPKNTTAELYLVNALDGANGFSDATSLLLDADNANPKDADDSECELIDVDNDGDYDVIFAGIAPGAERLLINNGKGALTAASSDVFKGAKVTTMDLELGDLNGDAKPDMVTAQGESGNFENRVWMNKGAADTLPPTIDNEGVPGETVPYVGPVQLVARIQDNHTSDSGPRVVNPSAAGVSMQWIGGHLFTAQLGKGLITQPIEATVTAQDRHGNKGTGKALELMPRHPLDINADGAVNDDDMNLMIDHLIEKGGLGSTGDIDDNGAVNLGDAQLLASGMGGFTVLSRLKVLSDTAILAVGAAFGKQPMVTVDGKQVMVTEGGPFSLIFKAPDNPKGNVVITAGGQASNSVEVAP